MKPDELFKSGDMTRVAMIPKQKTIILRDRSQSEREITNGKEENGYMDVR